MNRSNKKLSLQQVDFQRCWKSSAPYLNPLTTCARTLL